MYQEIVDANFVQTNVVERTAYNIIFHVISFLIDLQPLITSDIECQLEDVICSHINQFFKFLTELMTVSGIKSCPDKGNPFLYKMLQLPPNGKWYISLIKLCQNLETSGVRKVITSMQELFERMGNYNVNLETIIADAKRELQVEYVEYHGKKFSRMIETYVEQSLGGSGEPVDVTTTIIDIIN